MRIHGQLIRIFNFLIFIIDGIWAGCCQELLVNQESSYRDPTESYTDKSYYNTDITSTTVATIGFTVGTFSQQFRQSTATNSVPTTVTTTTSADSKWPNENCLDLSEVKENIKRIEIKNDSITSFQNENKDFIYLHNRKPKYNCFYEAQV